MRISSVLARLNRITTVRGAALCVLLLGASACGFQPLYGERSGVDADFGAVRVATGEGRAAYLVRQSIIDTLGAERPGVDPEYNLLVAVGESRRGFGLRTSDVATRFEISLVGTYQLIDRESGTVLTRGRSIAAASFDVTDDVYADIAVEENAKERAADLLAERLERELAIYFLNDAEPGRQQARLVEVDEVTIAPDETTNTASDDDVERLPNAGSSAGLR